MDAIWLNNCKYLVIPKIITTVLWFIGDVFELVKSVIVIKGIGNPPTD
jgi:hypothetical protein